MLPTQQKYVCYRPALTQVPRSAHLKLQAGPSLCLHSPRHTVALDIPRNSCSSVTYDSSFANSYFILFSPCTCFVNISILCIWIPGQMMVRQCWEAGSEGELKIWYYNRCYILPHKQCSKHCSSWKVCLQKRKPCPERSLTVLLWQRLSQRTSPSWCPFYSSPCCCPNCHWSIPSFLPFSLRFRCTVCRATVGLIRWARSMALLLHFYLFICLFATSFLSVALGRNTRKLLMFFSPENQDWITIQHTLCSLTGIWLC